MNEESAWERRRTVAAVVLILVLRAAAQWRLHLDFGPRALLSVENADRLAFLWGWAQDPSFFVRNPYNAQGNFWPPAFFWVFGPFVRLSQDPQSVALALNLALSAASLLPIYLIARLLSGPAGALASLGAAALLPWSLLIGMDAFFQPLLTLFLGGWLYGWLRWLKEGRGHGLSVACLAAAAFTRYEAWAFVAVFLLSTYGRPRFWMRCLAAIPVVVLSARIAALGGWGGFLGDVARFAPGVGLPAPNWAHLWSIVDGTLFGAAAVPLLALAWLRGDLQSPWGRDAARLTLLPLAVFAAVVVATDAYLFRFHLVPFQLLLLPLFAPGVDSALSALNPARRSLVLLLAAGAGWVHLFYGPSALRGEVLKAVTSHCQAAASVLSGWRPLLAESDTTLILVPRRAYNYGSERLTPRIGSPRLFEIALLPRRSSFDGGHGRYDKRLEDGKMVYELRGQRDALPQEASAARLILSSGEKVDDELGPSWVRLGGIGPHRFYARRDDPARAAFQARLSPYAGPSRGLPFP